ncbi:MAG: glyoxalase/bleomycin resistance/extradiol dioxygenase family protein [Clostridiaceae bacterium]|nr:glyoxalase/bleomycin resistance/extradiol dioxygenase family protein [Clostridiaceae bacterium]
MIIEHVAVWTRDLEEMKNFFTEFFNGKAGEKYINSKTGFHSYFISFDGGARLEIMQIPGISIENNRDEQFYGYSHIAFSVGSRERVDDLTERLRSRNYRVTREPSQTGDGYYESCILDLNNNRIEITV